jgi:hypothetical protein
LGKIEKKAKRIRELGNWRISLKSAKAISENKFMDSETRAE